jgi:hypothetical protein
LSSFFGSLDKRDDFIHECLVQNALRLPDQERQLFAEENVSGKFQVTSSALLFGVRFVGNDPRVSRSNQSCLLGDVRMKPTMIPAISRMLHIDERRFDLRENVRERE